jgi:ATP/maltotriose-dependent transcriptional regulator MalT
MTAAEQASLAPSGRVIRAKIRPPFAEGWIERPRPEALLAEAIESRRVVVVSATAGAGKTTLVAAVAPRLGRPTAWLTLDWTDTAPGRLVTYLEAALAVVTPRASGVAHEALAARIPHPEAAGLLAEAVAGERVVLVIDELQRLRDASEAWEVIEALLRHAPADMRFVLCSRRRVPASALPRHPGEVVCLGDEALALTVAEAEAMLEASGQATVDPAAVVQATGGWVTGVLFESWRVADQGAGDGHDDPLSSYLSAHILRDLPSDDREFLLTTSVLSEITAARASALGIGDAKARLASLRRAHIPASWSDGGCTLRCHPRFREYLQSELEIIDSQRLRALYVAHGQLLASEGHHDEATEVLLRAGATVEALEPAATAIFDVINRLDFALAKRWLDALGDVEPEGMSPFVIARLTLAVATENPGLGVDVADRLAAGGKLEEVASSSSIAAWMISYCYVLAGRYDDMVATFALAPHDAEYQAVRAFIGIFGTDRPPGMPELSGGPVDNVLLPSLYGYGRLARTLEISAAGGWMQAFSQPWLIAALRDAGRIREAVDLYEAVRARRLAKLSLEAAIAPRVLTTVGRRTEALEAIGRGRRLAQEASSVAYELLGRLQEARMFLRLDRDPLAAMAALDPVERHPFTHQVGFLGTQLDCWCGFALLLAGRNVEALARLRRAVTVMRRTRQMLEMPSAAVYLAEAEWRMGNEEAADDAADLALEAARVQGFNQILLEALRDFPAVLSRRLDAESSGAWRSWSRARK